MSVDLQQALEALYGLERRKGELGLAGTRALLGALGDPQRRFRSVHVAGTNGKGTVCALIERVLRAAGHRTGLYTSPHLVDFRERIRVCGRWADEVWLERRLQHIEGLPQGRSRTFFEVCTALAFDAFADQGVEIAVVEVGLGGRLDCTNVIDPELTVITSIGLDHTEILGDTIEAIAAEKAGIIKPGVPVVTGARGAARRVIETIARERGARVIAGARPTRSGRSLPENGIARANLGVALRSLAILAERGISIGEAALAEGLARVRWPGRLEACPSEPRLWWDGAHNADGVHMLARAWRWAHDRAPVLAVVALSKDKDAAAFLAALKERLGVTRIVATRSRSSRALEPARLARIAAAAGLAARPSPDVRAALREALAADLPGPVLLVGSLFAVGEAMEALGGAPGEWL